MNSPGNNINSIKGKKLIISRNNTTNKNILSQPKKSNSYKKINQNEHLLPNNISPVHKKIIHNNTTNSINKTQSKTSNSTAQIFPYTKKQNSPNYSSLYKYLINKSSNNNILNNKSNYFIHNNNNILSFSLNLIQNLGKLDTKYMNINKLNNFNVNKFHKTNFPLSPINKRNKTLLKFNNIGIEDFLSFNKDNINVNNNNEKRVSSSKNEINNYIKLENSVVCQNANNINLNVNIFTKKGISEQNSILLKNQNSNLQNIVDSDDKNIKNIKENNKIKINISDNIFKDSYHLCNLTSRIQSKPVVLKNIKNQACINQSKKDDRMFAEEIHFKAVKFMQEIKSFDNNIDDKKD